MATIKLPDALGMWGGAVNNYIDGIPFTKLEPSFTVNSVYSDKANFTKYYYPTHIVTMNAYLYGYIIANLVSPYFDYRSCLISTSEGSKMTANMGATDYFNISFSYECDQPPVSVNCIKSGAYDSVNAKYVNNVVSSSSYTLNSLTDTSGIIRYFFRSYKEYRTGSTNYYAYALRVRFDSSLKYNSKDFYIILSCEL